MERLEDGFARRFRYVRISVSEACNYRCVYCLPDGYRRAGPQDFLSPPEVRRLARALTAAGVSKLRLTGGEPTVRADIADLIEACAAASPDVLAMTTNGWNLARHIADWAGRGLNALNVSIDSLDRQTFASVTGKDHLPLVLDGVDAALADGRMRVKINAVLLADTFAAGLKDWLRYIAERPVSVRFIELMRTADNAAFFAAQHIPGTVLREWLSAEGWRELPRGPVSGPAREFTHPDHLGRIGLIAPYSAGFCEGCNRLRITARGALRLCLFGTGGLDLRDLLQDDGQDARIIARIAGALGVKAAGHNLHAADPGDTRNLAAFGG